MWLYFKHNSRYQVADKGKSPRDDRFGMEINFEREVEVTESHFSLDAFTLLTRVGGIMGVGRTMVWMINLGLDNIILIYSRFRKSGCNIFYKL